MKLKKSFLTLAVLATLFSYCNYASAELQTIEANGRYIMGDSESENMGSAKEHAYTDAMRRVAEKAGVYVQSYSRVVNLTLVEDEIVSIAAQIIRIRDKIFTVSATAGGETAIINCKLWADVDTDDIKFEGKQQAEMLAQRVAGNSGQAPVEPVQSAPVIVNQPVVPVETPAPVVPVVPVETPAPVVPAVPIEKPKPVAPVVPVEKAKPVAPVVPVEKPQPVVPVVPVEKPKPVVPVEKPKPVVPAPTVESKVPVKADSKPVSQYEETKVVNINSKVSIVAHYNIENELQNSCFIPKPADFVGDAKTKMLKSKTVKYIPDPKYWDCVGIVKFPYYMGEFKGFARFIDAIVWIAPESVVRRGNKLKYQAVMYESEMRRYKVTNYIINFDEQYQAMIKGKEFSAYTGKFEKEDTQRVKGLKLPFNDHSEKKGLLHTEYMRRFLENK